MLAVAAVIVGVLFVRRLGDVAEPHQDTLASACEIAPLPSLKLVDVNCSGELEEKVHSQYRPKERYYRLVLSSGQPLAVGHTAGENWFDVITRTRRKGEKGGAFTGPYDVFGYDSQVGRWSYGEGPPAAAEIRRLLNAAFGAKERGRWT